MMSKASILHWTYRSPMIWQKLLLETNVLRHLKWPWHVSLFKNSYFSCVYWTLIYPWLLSSCLPQRSSAELKLRAISGLMLSFLYLLHHGRTTRTGAEVGRCWVSSMHMHSCENTMVTSPCRKSEFFSLLSIKSTPVLVFYRPHWWLCRWKSISGKTAPGKNGCNWPSWTRTTVYR